MYLTLIYRIDNYLDQEYTDELGHKAEKIRVEILKTSNTKSQAAPRVGKKHHWTWLVEKQCMRPCGDVAGAAGILPILLDIAIIDR